MYSVLFFFHIYELYTSSVKFGKKNILSILEFRMYFPKFYNFKYNFIFKILEFRRYFLNSKIHLKFWNSK